MTHPLYKDTGIITLSADPIRMAQVGRKKVLLIVPQAIGLIIREPNTSSNQPDQYTDYATLPAGVWPLECLNEVWLRSLPSGPSSPEAYVAVDRVEPQPESP